ncbi:MAG: hypothetical protein JXB17_09260, partial [Bacteroidales bacterium]|nr:hypothetical protein [Bacteroidales bacterium]
MKKIYLLISALLLCSVIIAQDYDLMIEKLADGEAPVIDGVVDALWDNHDQVDITIDDAEDYGITTINSAWFKMAWDDEALYLLLYRDDDDFATQWETGLADWQSDRDEIFFDVNVDELADGRGASDAQEGGTGAEFGHYQFTSIWVQDADEWSGSPGQWYHNAPFEFGYVLDGDEYYTEYKFPFSSLTINKELLPDADSTFQGGEGVIFGLVITISDVDMADNPTDQTFRKFMRWVDEGGWDTMDEAGRVLMSLPVAENVKNEYVNTYSTYPNPASDYIKISNISGSSDIQIFNVVGQLV